jgi:NAD(P)-dependent dehydrogenase (short-subunit alcohol dehydrogenase family)
MDTSSNYQPPDLRGRIALVAGATRGLGRGISLALGEAGATVYCTGRSTRANRLSRDGSEKASPFDHARRPETIEETAEMVSACGGQGIAAVVDHTRRRWKNWSGEFAPNRASCTLW